MRLAVLLLALSLALPAHAECPGGAPGDPAVTVQLFFGRNIKGGGTVDAAAWAARCWTATASGSSGPPAR